MTDIAAAIGLVQFAKLDRNTAQRQAIAARYDAAFEDLPIRLPVTPEGRTHVFHQYTIDVGAARDAIVADLAEAGRRRRTSTTRSRSTGRPTSWSAGSTPTCRSRTRPPPGIARPADVPRPHATPSRRP